MNLCCWGRCFGEVTPLWMMLDVLSSRLARTQEEVVTIILMLGLSFVQNLSMEVKMEILSEVTRTMFRATSLLSLVSTSQGSVGSYKSLQGKGYLER